ncbi:MAG TPA: hypothetical protein VEJ87_09605 [Acidimicrobiales bacterium]|nr:hypothetical protein [Acidimicrobiales bacterium]
MAYHQSAWFAFGAALGAISAALTGLLFVAVSIKSNVLMTSRNLSSRAAQSLTLFMTMVLTSLVLAAPQPRVALGIELVALSLGSGVVMAVLDHRAGHAADRSVANYLQRFSPNLVTPVLIAIGGVTLIVKVGGGFYWLLPAAIASLLAGVVSAWLVLVKVTS